MSESNKLFKRRRQRNRAKLRRTANNFIRLSVHRSSKHIYAQVIDDVRGITLAGTSSLSESLAGEKGTKSELSKKVGIEIAKKAKEAGIETVIFDRNGFNYHGRVKALAEGAREGGLKF